jgi:plasmid stability protein
VKRTTLALDDDIFAELKLRAAREGRRLQQVANDLLRQGLHHKAAPYRLKLRGWKAREQPGVDLLDRDKLFDLMNGRT